MIEWATISTSKETQEFLDFIDYQFKAIMYCSMIPIEESKWTKIKRRIKIAVLKTFSIFTS